MKKYKLRLGDCLDVMPTIKDNGVDAIICDPPYGLSFMGKNWDRGIPGVPFWEEALRIAKPGAHLLAFGGTRTHHRLMCAIEDAGWELRDCLMFLYGSGMPKGHNISKAIDKAAGAVRTVIGAGTSGRTRQVLNAANYPDSFGGDYDVTAPATDAAKQWDGWNTNLKPAWEPIILARKPISEKTIADNVLKWGTGAINVDACRIEANNLPLRVLDAKDTQNNVYAGRMDNSLMGGSKAVGSTNLGRWPANLIHDGSDEVVSLFPQSKGQQGDVKGTEKSRTGDENTNCYGLFERVPFSKREDTGSAARFFYSAPQDIVCSFCCLSIEERHIGTAEWQHILVNNAEEFGIAFQVTNESSAPETATLSLNDKLVQHVKSAGNLCSLCAIAIAQDIVRTQQNRDQESIRGLDFISEHRKQILIKHLVSYVGLLGNTDIIPTTDSLSLLFGSVFHAIEDYMESRKEKMDGEICLPSRLVYRSKASKSDRGIGNDWPTVKPTSLMRYLCRLITPPNGIIVDPFMGSGSTGVAALEEGFLFYGIDSDEHAFEIATKRIEETVGRLQYATSNSRGSSA